MEDEAQGSSRARLVDWPTRHVLSVVGVSVALYVAAVVGMISIAGVGAIRSRLAEADWWWLLPAFVVLLIGLAGYSMAYRGVYLAEGGPRVSNRRMLGMVFTGFGGLLAHGAGKYDKRALQASGASERDARVRVTALAGFEHGTLALIVCPTAIAALMIGHVIPRTDFTWPWAIAPIPGFVLAAWLAARYRERLRDRPGIAGRAGVFLDAVHVAVNLFRHPIRTEFAVVGMAVYWAADMALLWMTTAAFGVRMSVLSAIMVVGVGMIATRRTAPFGGAGLLLVALVPTVWYGAAVPFAAAALGVAAYQFMTLWLPLPGALISLPAIHGGDSEAPVRAVTAVAEADS